MSNAIHLTNKTAISLRKNAVRMKTLYFISAAVLSIVMAAAAVLLGIRWLPAAPFILALTVLLDVLIIINGRSVYLTMIGQAICTEAAAREIRAGSSESMRREKALNDLMEIQTDVIGMKERSRSEQKDGQEEPELKAAQNVIQLKNAQSREEAPAEKEDVRIGKDQMETSAEKEASAVQSGDAPRRRRRG